MKTCQPTKIPSQSLYQTTTTLLQNQVSMYQNEFMSLLWDNYRMKVFRLMYLTVCMWIATTYRNQEETKQYKPINILLLSFGCSLFFCLVGCLLVGWFLLSNKRRQNHKLKVVLQFLWKAEGSGVLLISNSRINSRD